MSDLKDKQIAALKAELDRMKGGGKFMDQGKDKNPLKLPAGGLKAMGKKAGGMMKKKGYKMGGAMKKKGMAAGGLTAAIKKVDQKKKGMARGGMMKKGYAMGGAMKKKGMSKGGKLRGNGIATRGFRAGKMVTMKGS